MIHPAFSFLLAQATIPATQPEPLDAIVDHSMIGLSVVAVFGILWQRLWKPASVLGPARVQHPRENLLLTAIMFAGALVWIGTPVFYFSIEMALHPGTHIAVSDLPANQLALLTSIPYTLAIITLICCDRMNRKKFPTLLGYTPRKIPIGILRGLLAFLIVMPLMYWTVNATQWFYTRIGYQHPSEVEMMRAMDQPGWSRILLILGATVLAPIFEELLFRGHLQTILRAGLISVAEKFLLPATTTMLPPDPAACPLQRTGPPSLNPLPPPLQIALTWLSILITSLLFARLHESWSAPMIFVLALCLGYVYERTGNLWACITIHALFNITETALYFGGSSR